MFTYIDTIEDLSFLNTELSKKPYIGVDTEFRRTTRDNMKLALLQINDGDEIYLIDALKIGNPKESCFFLESNSVVKIFHSCKEDLEAVYAWTGRKMKAIFDTQLANSFLEGDFSISYQDLVKIKLGIHLEKKETRSNWMKRPLSDAQLKYASLDVEYLINLYTEQKRELVNTSKLDWHDQDIKQLINYTFDSDLAQSRVRKNPISRSQENELLNRMNLLVERISKKEKINPTLFFSKKSQKDFLGIVLNQGLEEAFKEITIWRESLIKDELIELLK